MRQLCTSSTFTPLGVPQSFARTRNWIRAALLRRQRGCKYVWNRSYGEDLHELAPSTLWTIGGDVSGVDYDEGDADVSVDDATPRGRIGLASDPLDASVVFATDPVGARRLDVERGLVTWSGNPYCHDPRTPALENST